MKQILLALILAVTLATAAVFAKDKSFVGCTKDGVEAVLTLDLEDDASPAALEDIGTTFATVAKSLSAAMLLSKEGFETFVGSLTEEGYAAIHSIKAPPALGGPCSKA